jgi:Signal transduction histidine kinase
MDTKGHEGRGAEKPPVAVGFTGKATVLVVDDDEGLSILMAEALREAGHEVVTANSGAAAAKRLAERAPDLMVLDLKLKDVGGAELLKRLRKEKLKVPFIVVTGQGDEKVAVEVMKEGALDYVMKDSAMLELLPAVVKGALTSIERDRALAEAERTRLRLEKEVLEVSEREQHRIGQDLHDGLGQQLTAIEMMCASLKEDVAGQPELLKQVDRIGAMLREAIAQTRSMARGLVPVKDEPEALWASLVELAERTNSLGRVKCVFEYAAPVAVEDNAVAGHLYRIAQEAVNNAVKHSGARAVTIRLEETAGGGLELEVKDDGRGLAQAKGRGMGLQVMEHRAAVIGAELSVESRAGKGVTIRCRWVGTAKASEREEDGRAEAEPVSG